MTKENQNSYFEWAPGEWFVAFPITTKYMQKDKNWVGRDEGIEGVVKGGVERGLDMFKSNIFKNKIFYILHP